MNSSQTQYAKYLLFPNSDYNESGVDKNVNIKNNLNSSSKVKGKGSIEGKDITDLNKLNYKKQADKTNSPQTSKK